MFIIILYVLTLILYTDWECSLFKRFISIGIVTPLTSEAIIVTMHTLLYTIKASLHTCFAFNSLIGFQSSLIHIALVQFIFWLSLSYKLSKVKIALCSKLYKNYPLYDQLRPSVLELIKTKGEVTWKQSTKEEDLKHSTPKKIQNSYGTVM